MFKKAKLLLSLAALSGSLTSGAAIGMYRYGYQMIYLNTDDKDHTIMQKMQYKTNSDNSPVVENWSEIDAVVNVVVPKTLTFDSTDFEGTYTMTGIANRAFRCSADREAFGEYNNPGVQYDFINSIKTVSLPSTITTIGYEVFQNCVSLTTVNIPASVTSLGYSTFENCTSLVNVDFQANLSDGILPNNTFKGCTSLQEITLPESITAVGFSAFEGCTSLTTVNVMATSLSIAPDAFDGIDLLGVTFKVPAGCKANFSNLEALGAIVETDGVEPVVGETFVVNGIKFKTTSVNPNEVAVVFSSRIIQNAPFSLPSTIEYSGNTYNVVSIKDNAFEQSIFTSVTLPEGIREIGLSAFANCYYLESINFPATLTSIGSAAFENTLITSLVIPETVNNLNPGAFQNCPSLTEIDIKADIEVLNRLMFRNCTNLRKVTFPASLTYIADGVFSNCPELSEIVFTGNSLNLSTNALSDASADASSYTPRDFSQVEVVIPDAANLSGFDCLKDHVLCVKTPDGTIIYGEGADEGADNDWSDIVVYSIRAQDQARGALYADPDGCKLAAAGSTYSYEGYTLFANVAIDPNDPLQQFVLIEYQGKKYMYNLGTEKFCRTHGDANTCVDLVSEKTSEAKINEITVTYQEIQGVTYTIIQYGEGNLNFSNGTGHYGAIRIAGGIDAGTRMLCTPVEGVSLSKRQYAHAINILRGGQQLEKFNTALSLLAHTGVGYPVKAERDALTDVIYNLESTAEEMETAIAAYYSTTDIELPQSGKAYAIKARYTNGTYRYVTYNGTRLHISDTKPTDGTDIFILKATGEETANHERDFAMLNPAVGMFLTYYADGKRGVDQSQGYVPDYLTNDGKNANITLGHNPTPGSDIAAEDVFGTISLGAVMYNTNTKYRLMAGDNNYHNGQPSLYLFSNTRSSFFEFEEVENPMAIEFNDANHAILNNMATYVAPYKTVLPEGVTAYFISEVEENPLTRSETAGKAIIKELAKPGSAIPANTPVILSGDLSGATLEPATTESVSNIPQKFANLLGVTANGDVNRHVLNGDHFELTATPAAGSVYLQVPSEHTAETYSLDASDTTTSISELQTSDSANGVVYDLQGRRLAAPAKGVNIINGRKVLVR